MLLGLTIGSFILAFFLSRALNWLALIPWRKSAGKHWTERARELYPAARSGRMNVWLISMSLGSLSYAFFPEINFLIAGVSGFLGSVLAGFFFSREVFPSLQFKVWFRLVIVGLFLFFCWWIMLIFTIFNMPDNFGPRTWLIAGCVFIFMLELNCGLGLVLLKHLSVLQPASNRLKVLVGEVSQKMEVPVRATWILSTYVANAAAFPMIRQLIFTDKLLSILSDEEIKAVCAHELGHLNEPRKVLIVRGLVSVAFFPLIFARPLVKLGDNGASIYFLLLTGSLLLWIIGPRLGRRMEKRADKIAVQNQSSGAVYARALEKLYESSLTPAVMPNRSSKIHPNLYERIMTTGVVPDFVQPLPPKSLSWTSHLMWACFVISVAIMTFKICQPIGSLTN